MRGCNIYEAYSNPYLNRGGNINDLYSLPIKVPEQEEKKVQRSINNGPFGDQRNGPFGDQRTITCDKSLNHIMNCPNCKKKLLKYNKESEEAFKPDIDNSKKNEFIVNAILGVVIILLFA